MNLSVSAAVLTLVAVALGVLLGWVILALMGRFGASRSGSDATVAVLQREIEAVREEARRGAERTLASVRQEVGQFGGQVSQQLGQVQAAVTTQLQHVTADVNRQLQEGMVLLQGAQATMGQRLTEATHAVSEVHGRLGALAEATRRVEQLGRDIAGLEQILRAPKIRGGLGEMLLERLLGDILPAGAYRFQHAFRSGDKVDAAIVLGERLVPVDSKFPLENFRRLVEEPDEERRRQARRAFLRDVRNRVDEIAKKYILPDEQTFDFALMYIPAENVYYEVILKNPEEGDESVLEYALAKRVIPVSPNSLYAYLQVIVLGLRGLRVEQHAREIMATLGRLGGDLARVREHFDTLGRHVTNAKNKYEEAHGALTRLETKLEGLQGREGQPALPGVEER